jgi:very-short-patch-repair endonuclease
MAKKINTASILRKIKKAAFKKKRTQKEKDEYLKNQAKRMDKNPTAPEVAFAELLKELNIEYETQKIVGGKIFDFYIPSKNMLVEIDGVYFHAKDKEIKDMSSMQRRIFLNDKKKNAIANNSGYLLERVWEDEILDGYELTKSKFKYLLL